MSVQSKPLKVAALGMEQRTYNTLQLFFSDRCNNDYVLCDEKSADIFIIDMDGYQASKVLESTRKNHPHRPAILISVKENDNNSDNNNGNNDAVFVRKPIQLAALTSALTEAQKRIVPSRRPGATRASPAFHMTGNSSRNTLISSQHAPDAASVQNAFVQYESFQENGVSNSAASYMIASNHSVDKHIVHKNIVHKNIVQEIDAQTTIVSTKPVSTKPVSSKTVAASYLQGHQAGQKVKYFVNSDRLNSLPKTAQQTVATPQRNPKHKAKTSPRTAPIVKSSMDFKAGVNDSGIRFVGDLNVRFNPRNPKLISAMQYRSESTLQGYFTLAYKIALSSCSNVVLQGPWRPIVILYNTKEVCVERDFRHLFALSTMTFKKEDVSIFGLGEDESIPIPGQVVVKPIEQFLWKLALRTSQGRVPEGTELETPIRLRRWPNFTRCDVTPHALRIAALWAKHPSSLVDTAKILAIPQQYVFAFYSAAVATNLVTYVSAEESELIKPQLIRRHAYRNLFQHILDRLRKF